MEGSTLQSQSRGKVGIAEAALQKPPRKTKGTLSNTERGLLRCQERGLSENNAYYNLAFIIFHRAQVRSNIIRKSKRTRPGHFVNLVPKVKFYQVLKLGLKYMLFV